jgi:hypothetical protein
MTAQDLLEALRTDGVRVTAIGDRLELDAPRGAMTQDRLDQVRVLKQELLALLAEPGPPAAPAGAVEDSSFLEIVEDARRFQAEGKPGPWAAFTMSDIDLEGAIGDLSPELHEDFDLRIGIYRRDGLPDDHGRRIALFFLASEHEIPLGVP